MYMNQDDIVKCNCQSNELRVSFIAAWSILFSFCDVERKHCGAKRGTLLHYYPVHITHSVETGFPQRTLSISLPVTVTRHVFRTWRLVTRTQKSGNEYNFAPSSVLNVIYREIHTSWHIFVVSGIKYEKKKNRYRIFIASKFKLY